MSEINEYHKTVLQKNKKYLIKKRMDYALECYVKNAMLFYLPKIEKSF